MSSNITYAEALKTEGNEAYQCNQHVVAIRKYMDGVSILLGGEPYTSDELISRFLDIDVLGESVVCSNSVELKSDISAQNFIGVSSLPQQHPNGKEILDRLSVVREGCDRGVTEKIYVLAAVLFSNASQVFFDLYSESNMKKSSQSNLVALYASANAATFSCLCDPLNVKAWYRRVMALHAAGYSFQAFIIFYYNINSQFLHRVVNHEKPAKQMVEINSSMKSALEGIGETLGDTVGVHNISKAFSLQKLGGGNKTDISITEDSTGISTVASEYIPSDSVIFVEDQLKQKFLSASLESNRDQTTEELVAFFSKQVMNVLLTQIDQGNTSKGASVSEKGSPPVWSQIGIERAHKVWGSIVKLMIGSWPRFLGDLDPTIVAGAKEVICDIAKVALMNGLLQDTIDTASFRKPLSLQPSTSSNQLNPLILTLDEVTHMTLICRYNCFQNGFFRACALANHSCDPNAATKYDPRSHQVHMIAVKDIKPGEHITVKYFADMEYMMGVGRRRELLHKCWLFWCDCHRCSADLGLGERVNNSTSMPSSGSVAFDTGMTHEYVTCHNCNDKEKGYAHLPTPGLDTFSEGTNPSAVDKHIPRDAQCLNCHKIVTVIDTTMKMDTINGAITDLYPLINTGFSLHPSEALKMFEEAWSRIRSLVHIGHWSRRVMLYILCLYLRSVIEKGFQSAINREYSVDYIASGYLQCVGEGEISEDMSGGRMLRYSAELWSRIKGFYPPSQGWALHVMITKLVVLNVLQQGRNGALSQEECVRLLSIHAPLCGKNEVAVYFKFIESMSGPDSKYVISPGFLTSMKKAMYI